MLMSAHLRPEWNLLYPLNSAEETFLSPLSLSLIIQKDVVLPELTEFSEIKHKSR